ncbi:MAG: dihydroorotase, partial [Pseudomonadota bacterium]
MAAVVPFTSRRFRRAIVMPNLKPPVTTTADAAAYRERILAQVPAGHRFAPLMTLYLTDNTTPDEIRRASGSGFVHGVKLYPAGATTNSDHGVTDLERTYPALEAMAEAGMLLLVHGEVTAAEVDIFDREARFIDNVLAPLVQRFDTLKVVFEHVTTRQAVQFVQSRDERVAATITPQHLMFSRNAMLAGGIRPHLYCLPVLKRETHREALVAAATSGDKRFFLGTDSAPHARHTKENACGCAGVFSAHAGIELYAQVFDEAGCLEKLEGFASEHGADFYGLPRNDSEITLIRQPWPVPATYPMGSEASGDNDLVPLQAGLEIAWQLQDVNSTRET